MSALLEKGRLGESLPEYEIVDMHAHLYGGLAPWGEDLAEHLIRAMNQSGVKTSLVSSLACGGFRMEACNDLMYEALRKGAEIDDLYKKTFIKPWFIGQMKELVELEEEILKFKGKALLPSRFVLKYVVPPLFSGFNYWQMVPHQVRKYFAPHRPDKDIPVGQIGVARQCEPLVLLGGRQREGRH
jgi:hypothetical protein